MKKNPLFGKPVVYERSGVANALAKFHLEKKGCVAFLGGSITEMNGYSALTEDFLKSNLPDCEFTFLNAGIASTCSNTGAFRLDRDILSRGIPDLLFVEFAVNDNQDGHLRRVASERAMEGIVRRARRKNPYMDIVFLYSANESHIEKIKSGKMPHEILAHERVAKHYKLASVNFARSVTESIVKREYTWKQFGGVHPAPFGAGIYAGLIAGLISGCRPAEKRVKHPVPDRLSEFCLERGKLVPVEKAKLGDGWHLGVPDWEKLDGEIRERFQKETLLFTEVPYSDLTLEFKGTAIGLFLLAGPDSGKISFRIDDAQFRKRDTYTSWSAGLHYPYTLMLDDTLAEGKHRLSLRVIRGKNPASKGFALRILAFAVNS